jgi:hypothetical protein
MHNRIDDITARLETNRDEILGFFRSLSPRQQAAPVYEDEVRWTVRQVLAHLITIEETMPTLFENILSGGPGFTAEDFDVDRFNRSQPQKLDGLTMAEVTERFHTVRNNTIANVKGMKDADLEREGSHPFHGRDRLERFVRWAYEHAALHLEDARRALAESSGS